MSYNTFENTSFKIHCYFIMCIILSNTFTLSTQVNVYEVQRGPGLKSRDISQRVEIASLRFV